MNTKRINWGFSIILIIALVGIIWSTNTNVRARSFDYGIEFNKMRDSLKVPRIEDNWILYTNNKWRKYWTHPGRGVNSHQPMHLAKTSNFKGDTLVSEEDDFHYAKTDTLSYRLVTIYHFDSAKWSCRLCEYRTKKYLEVKAKPLTLIQADSLLNEWKLTRSHGL